MSRAGESSVSPEDMQVLNTLSYLGGDAGSDLFPKEDSSVSEGQGEDPSADARKAIHKLTSGGYNNMKLEDMAKDEDFKSLITYLRANSDKKSSTFVTGGELAEYLERAGTDPQLKDLKIADVDPNQENGYGAFCFTKGEGEDRKAYVVYRGTASDPEGKTGWPSNINMLWQADTEAQVNAASYYQYLRTKIGGEGKFFVTGHSQGGNDAMYVAVTQPGITGCYAYDAPGFGGPFYRKYHDLLIERGEKVFMFNFMNDIVSPLFSYMTRYFTRKFVWNGYDNGDSIAENHAPNAFFRNGMEFQYVNPGPLWNNISGLSTWIVGTVPESQLEGLTPFVTELVQKGTAGQSLLDLLRQNPEKTGQLLGIVLSYPGLPLLIDSARETLPQGQLVLLSLVEAVLSIGGGAMAAGSTAALMSVLVPILVGMGFDAEWAAKMVPSMVAAIASAYNADDMPLPAGKAASDVTRDFSEAKMLAIERAAKLSVTVELWRSSRWQEYASEPWFSRVGVPETHVRLFLLSHYANEATEEPLVKVEERFASARERDGSFAETVSGQLADMGAVAKRIDALFR